MLQPGESVGGFEIRDKIAEGGMGVVYRARQIDLDRDVALKILKPSLCGDASFVERFVREAASAASLDHPNIVKIHTIGEEGPYHFFAMEYIAGKSLKEILREQTRFSIAEALDITIKIADALACAAEKQMIHRDIKPANIMVQNRNRVKVTDFGLAKCLTNESDLTEVGKVLGTVDYMSPEQALGQDLDTRSDIYSLGILFFEMLAGRTPFKGGHATTVIYSHVYEPPPPVEFYNRAVPQELTGLVHRMLAKKPEERPETTPQLVQELEELREALDLFPGGRGKPRAQTITRNAADEITATENTIYPEDCPPVLVIDDDAGFRHFCERVLADLGYGVFQAADGIEGLQLWRDHKPAIVLLDLEMASLSGMALLEEYKHSQLRGQIYIVSAHRDWDIIKKTASYGIKGYLAKPVSADNLRNHIPPAKKAQKS